MMSSNSYRCLLSVCVAALWCTGKIRPVNGRDSSSPLSSNARKLPSSVSTSQVHTSPGKSCTDFGSTASKKQRRTRQKRKKRKRRAVDKNEKEDIPTLKLANGNQAAKLKRKRRKARKGVTRRRKIRQRSERDKFSDVTEGGEIMKTQPSSSLRMTETKQTTKEKSRRISKPNVEMERHDTEKDPKEHFAKEEDESPRKKIKIRKRKRRSSRPSRIDNTGISAIPSSEGFIRHFIDDNITDVPVVDDKNDLKIDKLEVVDISSNTTSLEDKHIVSQLSSSPRINVSNSNEVDALGESYKQIPEDSIPVDNPASGSDVQQKFVDVDKILGSENCVESSAPFTTHISFEQAQVVSKGGTADTKPGPADVALGTEAASENAKIDGVPEKRQTTTTSEEEDNYTDRDSSDIAVWTEDDILKAIASGKTTTLDEVLLSNRTQSESILKSSLSGSGRVGDLIGTNGRSESSTVAVGDDNKSAISPSAVLDETEFLKESKDYAGTKSVEALKANSGQIANEDGVSRKVDGTAFILDDTKPHNDTVTKQNKNKEIGKDASKHFTAMSMSEHINRTKDDLIVSVVTWNLAEASPSEDESLFISNLCKGDKKGSLGNSDFVLIAGQECENIKPRRSEGHRSIEFRRLIIQMLGKEYVPIALHMLGGIQFALFCKRKSVGKVQSAALADVTCGIGNVFHNKGAIGCFIKLRQRKEFALPSRLLFVGAHMAAHVKKSEARDADYWRIMSELESQAPSWFMKPSLSGDSSGGTRLQAAADFVVFCGDLNYRIDIPREEVENAIEEMTNRNNDNESRQRLLRHDQLRASIAGEKAFPGFCEGEITFMPTFKFDKGTKDYDTSKKQRIPAWTDRILYKSSHFVEVVKYDSAVDSLHSDHRPVFGTFRILAIPLSESPTINPESKRRRRIKKRNRRDGGISDD